MQTSTVVASKSKHSLLQFLGRQPILDIDMNVYGHELLFHPSSGDETALQGEQVTFSVIDNALLLMSESSEEISFIKCASDALLSGAVTLLPPGSTVLEIEEQSSLDMDLLECCRELRKAGYHFALDGASESEFLEAFVEIATFVKVDFSISDSSDRAWLYDLGREYKVRFIADRLETEPEVEVAWSEGCNLFQGYYFCKPIVATMRVIPQNQLVYVRLMTELTREPSDISAIEQLVMSDTSVCYRLLRLVNSALYALPQPVASIRSALMMIGDDEFRKLVTVALANLVETPKAKAAARIALERAKLCELIGQSLNQPSATFYLLGMLSLMDVILNIPMKQVLEMLPLDVKLKAALLGEPSPYTMALELVRAREAGGWMEVTSLQEKIGLPGTRVNDMHVKAVQWVDRINAV